MAVRAQIELVICDLDNTLYDWVTFFSSAFDAMVNEAIRVLGVPKDQLLDELQDVHRRYHSSEQPFALLDTVSVVAAFPGASRRERLDRLDSAFHAFNSARKATLKPYPGVVETLGAIEATGARIAAHTEATVANAEFRLNKLGLVRYFSRLYAVADAGEGHPAPELLHKSGVGISHVRALMLHERKPDRKILEEICAAEGVEPDRTLYVGDSLVRDISMAKAAGVHSAWAKYGTKYSPEHWNRLVRVTHWTTEDVKRAQEASKLYGHTVPDVVLERSFGELLDHYDFVRPTAP